MNSLLVVVKSNLFPQFALAEVMGGGGGGGGERRVCGYQSRVGGHGTRAGRRQSIAMGAQSIGSEVAAAVILTTLTVTHNRYLVEAPGKGWAHGVRGIR